MILKVVIAFVFFALGVVGVSFFTFVWWETMRSVKNKIKILTTWDIVVPLFFVLASIGLIVASCLSIKFLWDSGVRALLFFVPAVLIFLLYIFFASKRNYWIENCSSKEQLEKKDRIFVILLRTMGIFSILLFLVGVIFVLNR